VTFDILINNAGIYGVKDDRFPELECTKNIIKTNLIGPMRLTKALLSFLSSQARIVNVSALMGALKFQSPQIQ
jgi:NAD(P)-dependent dehydrogenase (short-subunit alcohol dehydrogenase family)